MDKHSFKECYEALPQKKQRFSVGNVQVSIEVRSWPVKTNSGLDGGIETMALVEKAGVAIVGRTVCIPTDKFDFRFGAKQALERALSSSPKFKFHYFFLGIPHCAKATLIDGETEGKIWKEFKRVLPK
jgi:hypothetical protein